MKQTLTIVTAGALALLLLLPISLLAATISYEYDALDRLIQVSYPDGTVIEYRYDPAGNRTQRLVSGSDTCPHHDDWVLHDQMIADTRHFEACQTITAGPAFTVTSSGHVTFTAGQRITLRPGFRVQAGGRFNARIDTDTAIRAAESDPPTRALYPGLAATSSTPSDTEVLWSQATALTWSELPAGLRALLAAHDAVISDAQRSADGTVIVFTTDTALLDADTNTHSDVYAYTVDTERLELISRGRHGQAADAPSHSPQLAAAGHHIVFLSQASDLVTGPSNAYTQLYHHDLRFATTVRLTTTAAGWPGRGDTHTPLLAGDWAIYRTDAPDLAPAGAGLYRQHLHDGYRQAIGLDHWGQPDPQASQPTATADGEQIAYQRPEQQRWQILLYDLLSVERLSLLYDPVYGLLDHCCAVLSADGHFIAYREQGEHGPTWLHLLDRDTNRHTRLPWPEDAALQERAPQFRNEATELWWINPEQGPGQPEILHRVENPLYKSEW